jgi:hypothetical protein
MKHTALVEYHTDDPQVLALTINRTNDAGDDVTETFTGTSPITAGLSVDDFDHEARAAIYAAGYAVTGERDGADSIDLGGMVRAATWTVPVAPDGSCVHCGDYLVQDADGAWNDLHGRCGCGLNEGGDGEHEPA